MECGDCGKPFVVGDTSRSAASPDPRPYPVAVALTPSAALPTAPPLTAPRAGRSLPPENEHGTGRWVVIGICLFFLLVILGGIGFMISRATPGGGWGGPSTAPAIPFRGGPDDPDEEERARIRRHIRDMNRDEKIFPPKGDPVIDKDVPEEHGKDRP
jgi:hypothetical protein